MKKPERVKTISSVITQYYTVSLFIAMALFSFVCLNFFYFSAVRVMTRSLTNTVNGSAQRIEGVIEGYKNLCGSFSSVPVLAEPDSVVPYEIKMQMLNDRIGDKGFLNCGIIGKDGKIKGSGESLRDQEYFRGAINGIITVSDPVISDNEESAEIIISGPIWKGGIQNSEAASVIFFSISPEVFNQIVRTMGPYKHASGRVIGDDGITIASPDGSKVISQYSNIVQANFNPKFKKTGAIEEAVIYQGKRRFYSFNFFNPSLTVATPVKGTPGWYLILEGHLHDYLTDFYIALLIFTVWGLTLIFFSRKKMKDFATRISNPVTNMAERLRKASVGDFTSEVQTENSLTEVQVISAATQKLLNRMAIVLNDTTESAEKESLSNLFDLIDFQKIAVSFEEILKVNICIYDSDGVRILGDEPEESLFSYEESIIANKRYCGKFLGSSIPGCPLSETQIKELAVTFVSLISNFFSLSCNRESSYQAFRKNELINMNDILSENELLIQQISVLISDSSDSLPADLKRQLEILISRMTESTEMSRFTDMNNQITEQDYVLEEMTGKINSKTLLVVKPHSEKLFGDKENIERSVNRILKCLEEGNQNSDIGIIVTCEKRSMGTMLKIRISDKSPALTENQIERLKLLAKNQGLNGVILTGNEHKILSAFKQIHKMSGTVSIDCFGSGILNVVISIPQLEAK